MVKRINAEDAPSELAEMARRFHDEPFDTALQLCVPELQSGFRQNFRDAVGSTGMPWPPRRDTKPHPLLIDTGELFAAVASSGVGHIERVVGGRELQIGVDASVDLGGIRGAKAHNFGWPESNLPQREFLHASEHTLDVCAELLVDEMLHTLFVF